MTRRWLLVFSALLLFARGADCGGVYQRTKDGGSLIWNSSPSQGDVATWSGSHDANGYATGYGTLTWYKRERAIVTGSNIASTPKGSVELGHYTGKMVRGKFEGQVVSVDVKGKTSHETFLDGGTVGDRVAGPRPDRIAIADQPRGEPTSRNPETEPAAAGPPLHERRSEKVSGGPIESAHGESAQAVMTPPSSLRVPMVAAAIAPRTSVPLAPSEPSPSPAAVEPVVRNRIIADFREQAQSVFSRVGDATGNFHEIDRLDAVQELPTPVSESVDSLMDRARDFRAKLGYETALRECPVETQTTDALSVVDQMTRNIAGSDAAKATNKVSEFLTNNPEPLAASQRSLWRYLKSVRSLCNRLEKQADVHLQQAQLLVSAGRMGDAIREYQEAYRIFPTPATAEKSRQLQENSLGL